MQWNDYKLLRHPRFKLEAFRASFSGWLECEVQGNASLRLLHVSSRSITGTMPRVRSGEIDRDRRSDQEPLVDVFRSRRAPSRNVTSILCLYNSI